MYNESFRNPQSLVSYPETENFTNRNETTKQFRRDYVAVHYYHLSIMSDLTDKILQ